jgi:hypothetical protein
MSVGAEQYQGSVNIRFEEINNCGEVLNDSVISGLPRMRQVRNPQPVAKQNMHRQVLWIPGSRFARPGMTRPLFGSQ